MTCEEVMTAEVATVAPRQSAADAARTMRDLNIGFVPVCQSDGSVVGTVTGDITLQIVAAERPASTAVEVIMTADVVACRPTGDIARAEELMRENQINRVVVVGDDGRLAGVISIADLAQLEDERRVGEVAADISGREADVH